MQYCFLFLQLLFQFSGRGVLWLTACTANLKLAFFSLSCMILFSGFLSLSPSSDECLVQEGVNFQKCTLAIWCMWSFKSGDADIVQIVKWSLQKDVANMGLRITGHLRADMSLASGGAAVPAAGCS